MNPHIPPSRVGQYQPGIKVLGVSAGTVKLSVKRPYEPSPLVSGVRWLVEAAVAKGLWRRIRFSAEERVNAALAYMAGLSYREIAYVLGLVGAQPRGCEAVCPEA